jgi:hypothetical protein
MKNYRGRNSLSAFPFAGKYFCRKMGWSGGIPHGLGLEISYCAKPLANADDQYFSLRSKRFRYIRCRNGEEELSDHQNDPNEWNNLAGNPEFSPVVEQMKKHLPF